VQYKMIVILMLVSLLGTNTAVIAAPKPEKMDSAILEKQFKECSEKAKNEMDLGKRLYNVSNKADIYVKKLETSVMIKLDTKEEKDLFLKAAKAWYKYVDLTCQYDTNSLGSGTMQGSVSCSCHIELQLSRIKALEKYYKCLQTNNCDRPFLFYRELSCE
jgi:uncharacterized protein YecT (DUF1311 family)